MGKTLTGVKFNPRNPGNDSVYISSDFGMRTIKLNGKKTTRMHNGVDLTNGSKVYTVEEGKVTDVRTNIKGKDISHSAGNYIKIKHPNGSTSVYYHLAYKSIKVKVGDKVKRGQYIANEGATGNVTGPHLHFGVYLNKKWVDPKPYLLGTKSLLKEKVSFNIIKGNNYTLLEDRNVYSSYSNKSTRKLVKDLTKSGRAHATSKKLADKATLKASTVVTVLDVLKNDENHTWIKIPSGWICAITNDEKIHIK